jgi:hypothetical protein
MAWPRRNVPTVLLGAALLAAAVLLFALTRELTFFQDTWSFLLNRHEWTSDALLMPHNEHIVVIPVALELFFLDVFGMSSAAPEYVALILALLVTATLLFVYVRRRLGPWPALFAALLLLFLGPAWWDILWPFELGFVGSLLFGIAMLLALDRDDRRGDVAACVFLVLSAGFSSLGISFMAAAAVDVFLRRRERGWGRVYVVAVPVILFAIWYLGWGTEAESHLTLRNVLASPPFVAESLAASLEALLGLNDVPPEGVVATVTWGQPLLVALVAAVAYGQWRRPGFSSGFWVVAAAAAANWFLAAFNFIPGREPTTSRYLYAGGVFVLLLLTELLRGTRIGRGALAVAGAVTVAAVAANLVQLKDGSDWLKNQTVLTRSDLGAIEIARRTVAPEFALDPETAGTPSLIDIQAGPYLETEREFGSPAYTPAELAGAPEVGRQQADIVLAKALPLATETTAGVPVRPSGRCTIVRGGSEAPVPLAPGISRIEVTPGPHASFNLRRFATESFPVTTEGAPGASTTRLWIRRDASTHPWQLQVVATQPVRVCR